MRLSSVNSTPDKTRREMELKEKTQILWMDPTEKDDQIKLAEKLDTDSQHKALNMSSQQQQTFDSMDLPQNLTEVLEAQENNASSSKLKVHLEKGHLTQIFPHISKSYSKFGLPYEDVSRAVMGVK